MKRMKKLLAFLLAAMLLLTMIPISASAAPTPSKVQWVRLEDIDRWKQAALTQANATEGDDVVIQRIFLYNKDNKQLNSGTPTPILGQGYDLKTSIGGIDPSTIDRIVLTFTYTEYGELTKTVSAVFNADDFTIGETTGSPGVYKVHITLNDEALTPPEEVFAVRFFAELNGELGNFTLYDIAYVESGEKIGDQMPAAPPLGAYKFAQWQTQKDGGDQVTKETVVTSDLNVYAAKTTQGQGTAVEYRVIKSTDARENALYIEVADKYNAETGKPIDASAFSIDYISVNGKDESNFTNPYYFRNEWREGGEWYYIYNVNTPVADSMSEEYGTQRVERLDITGITVYGTTDDDDEVKVFIPENELSIVEIGTGNAVFSISVVEKLDGIDKKLVTSDDGLPFDPNDAINDAITYPVDGKVTIPKDGQVTLLYKITVTGDTGSNYTIVDDDAQVVDGYELKGTITAEDDGQAVVYVTKTFDADDITSEKTLSNTAEVKPGEDTRGPDDGNDSDEEEIDAGVEGDEEEEPEDPGKPSEPTEDELNQLYVYLECINADAQHVGERFHLDQDNSHVTVDFTTGICTVEPRYDFILQRYNEQVAGGHTYADEVGSEKTFTLVWTGEAWDNGNASPITRQVKCETPEQPGEGETPAITDDDIIGALDGKMVVTIDCNNPKVSHSDKTYKLSDLNVPKAGFCLNKPDKDGDGNWIAEVTIIPGEFVTKYSNDMNDAHKLNPYLEGKDYKTITLKWERNDWVLADQNQTPVRYTVTCDVETTPGQDHYIPYPVKPEDPTDPDQTGVSDLLETDDHIQYLFGYPDGSFGPDRNMTRAEAAQMFYNLLKNKNVDAEPAFDDVPDGAWYATPVNVMAELGIVDGVGDDKFEPNREITRAEFTTMAMRFADVPSGGVNIFTDVAPSDWFYSYVVNSIQYGWIEGYGDGTFRPDRLITRAEVTTIVNRMLDRQADMAFVIQNRDKLTKFTDLTTEHWAYYTIVEATNEHNYKKPAIGEDWTSLIK